VYRRLAYLYELFFRHIDLYFALCLVQQKLEAEVFFPESSDRTWPFYCLVTFFFVKEESIFASVASVEK